MTNLSELIERGRTFYAAGELGKALDYFERVLAADPTHGDATIAAGKIALEARRFDRAEKHFASALRQNPKTLAVSLARVRALRELQRTSEARTLLHEIVRDHGARPDVLEQLAECDHLLVDYDAAAASFERIIPARPDDPELYLKFADALAGSYTRWDEAEAAYERAIAIGWDHPVALRRAAYNALLGGRWALAEKAARRHFAVNAEAVQDPWNSIFLAEALEALGHTSDAAAALRQALASCEVLVAKSEPIHAIRLRALSAYILFRLGQRAPAEAIFDALSGGDLSPREYVYENDTYLPDTYARIEKLTRLVRGRDTVVLLYGPSIVALDAVKHELAGLDLCYASVNKFDAVEERILVPLGRTIDIVVTANPADICRRFDAFHAFLTRDDDSMLLTSDYALSSFDPPHSVDRAFVRRFDHKLLFFDPNVQMIPTPITPLHLLPGNTLSVALPLLALAGARRIFVFGADGGAPPGAKAEQAYFFDPATTDDFEVRKRREMVRRLTVDAWRCDRLAGFLTMAAAKLFQRSVPPIYVCTPSSNHAAFPKLTVAQALEMLKSRA